MPSQHDPDDRTELGAVMKHMRIPLLLAGLTLALAGCNQTGGSQIAEAPASAPIVASDPAPQPVQVAAISPAPQPSADEQMWAQPPIYNPLVDLNGRNQARYSRDHDACRRVAAPQERAAREAMQRAQAGAAIQVAGAMAGFIPGSSFRSAVNIARASEAAQTIGGGVAAGGAQSAEMATQDYALVVNNCLSRRGYILLRD